MKAFKTSAIYICTVLGAGFATGRELIVYFVKYGLWGFIGIIIASFLFGFTAYKALKKGYKSISDVADGRITYMLTFMFLIVLYSAMLSACGELVQKIFDIPYISGTIAIALITYITVKFKSIGDVSIILCPIMIVTALITGIYIMTNGNYLPVNTDINLCCIPSAFIYAAYNIITAAAVIITEGDKKSALKTAVISGILIGFVATVLSLPLYFNFELIKHESLPLLALLPKGSIITYGYIFMLMCAIFTTAVSNCLSAAEHTKLSPLLITLTALLLSFIGFSNIVDKVYFVFGIMGLGIMFKLIN